MWESFNRWHEEHQIEISWFFIGLFTINFVGAIGRGDLFWSIINFIFIAWNYMVYKKYTGK